MGDGPLVSGLKPFDCWTEKRSTIKNFTALPGCGQQLVFGREHVNNTRVVGDVCGGRAYIRDSPLVNGHNSFDFLILLLLLEMMMKTKRAFTGKTT